MSRYRMAIPINAEMRQAILAKFDVDIKGGSVQMAWGLDNDGYFLQLWTDDDNGELYLEDGFMGTSKNRIIELLEKYNILEFVRDCEPEKFQNLCLDLPL